VPPLQTRVVDRAALLSDSAHHRLERELAAYERETQHQVVVHTTPSLEGLSIEEYSVRVAEAWKVGNKRLDNGVILTVAPKERKVRIEVGYGLEGVIPDAIASRIIRDRILPEFREGSYEAGILAGVDAIRAAARGEVVRAPPRDRPEGIPPWLKWILLLCFLVFLFLVFRGVFVPPFVGGPRRHQGRFPGGFPGRFPGGFGGGFGGGRGRGGSRGGGGSFGGGGASGGW
jgi:uncharacterized protein